MHYDGVRGGVRHGAHVVARCDIVWHGVAFCLCSMIYCDVIWLQGPPKDFRDPGGNSHECLILLYEARGL